jgi:hypothetical protein
VYASQKTYLPQLQIPVAYCCIAGDQNLGREVSVIDSIAEVKIQKLITGDAKLRRMFQLPRLVVSLTFVFVLVSVPLFTQQLTNYFNSMPVKLPLSLRAFDYAQLKINVWDGGREFVVSS